MDLLFPLRSRMKIEWPMAKCVTIEYSTEVPYNLRSHILNTSAFELIVSKRDQDIRLYFLSK